MEPWKGATIGALLLAIVGYGVLQNRPAAPPSPENPAGNAQQPPAPKPEVEAWVGKTLVPWSFPASQWENTPRPITPADLKGKAALIEFWRRGCSHCEDAVPFMNAVHKHYGKRLPVVTFQSPGLIDDPENEENSWPKVKEWMKQRGVMYPVAFDTDRKLKDKYNVSLYPFVLLVGKDGKVVYAHTGHTPDKEQALAKQIEKLVGK